MFFFQKKSKKHRWNSAAGKKGVSDAQEEGAAHKKAAHILKGIFHIATMVSDFDLKLSFFGDKIEGSAHHLNSMFSEVASSSEEMTTSMTQIADSNSELHESLNHISKNAESLSQNSQKSNDILGSIQQENSEMTAFSRDMDQSVRDLLDVIHKINEAVKGINQISDQTKLLSLNASIEAARAGEAGRGFGVVAEQIRSLSGTTKNLTSNIDNLLAEIDKASSRSRSSVDKTLKSIETVSQSVREVSQVLSSNTEETEKMTAQISNVTEASKGINDSLQESSATIESVNQSIQKLSESAKDLQGISNSIHETSASLCKMVGSKLCSLSNEDFIETVENAIKAHQAWVRNVKNMAGGMKILPLQTDEHKCGFGHFYYAVTPSSEKLAEPWKSVESLHHDLHQTGDRVIDSIQKGNAQGARSAADRAEQISREIIDKFQQMIQTAKVMSASGESVF